MKRFFLLFLAEKNEHNNIFYEYDTLYGFEKFVFFMLLIEMHWSWSFPGLTRFDVYCASTFAVIMS